MSTEFIPGLVSTIIPVFNRAGMLHEAVDSVLHQTYRPIEIIIVDDGSVDETPVIADEFGRRNHEVIVLHQGNGGPGLAREAGRQVARGEFIQYLDSDDLLLPRKFELQVAGLRANPDCAVSYCKTSFSRQGEISEAVAWKRTGEHIATMFPSFLESRWWGTSTPLYTRQVIDAAGPWQTLSNEEDWEYDCRIAAGGVRLYYVPEFLSQERDHDGPRLSQAGSKSATALSSRAAAHKLILEHGRRAGIDETYPEMQHFARELFLLARQCGAARLTGESKELFELSRKASGKGRMNGLDYRLYRLLSGVLGWSVMGRISCLSDSFRL
jgi:glycosyltransferase involved in cell wall biosynthesis